MDCVCFSFIRMWAIIVLWCHPSHIEINAGSKMSQRDQGSEKEIDNYAETENNREGGCRDRDETA